MQLHALAQYIDAKIFNPKNRPLDVEILHLAPLDKAMVGHVSFFTNPKFKNELFSTQATAVIVKTAVEDLDCVQLVHSNPQLAMALVGQLFFSFQHSYHEQSELAVVSPTSQVDPSAILYPFCYIDDKSSIGKNTVIYPQVFIGSGCSIGDNCILFPGVVVMSDCSIGNNAIIHAGTVIGGDGFGFAPGPKGIEKIPQTGRVLIEDDVEIGALCTIDRATFDKTHLKQGVKLDSHVHVGHNVEVGEHSMLCAQVGIAGSTTIGKRFIGAGQAGVGPGLDIGNGIILGAKCGMVTPQSTPGEYHGMPAIPAKEWLKQVALLKRLPELTQTVRRLAKEIEEIKQAEKKNHEA